MFNLFTMSCFFHVFYPYVLLCFSVIIFFQPIIHFFKSMFLFGCTGSSLQHIGSNSLTQGQTQTTYTGSIESQPLDHQESPYHLLLKTLLTRSVQQLNPFPVFIIYYIFWVPEFLLILCKIISNFHPKYFIVSINSLNV